ncbi:MAG: DUF5709 domain-containing protein [Actinocatenispora sp.]
MSEEPNRNPATGTEQVPADAQADLDDPGALPDREGLPEYADDETPANRDIDDPQRQPVPGDHPLALDEFGTTAAEERQGEPLAGRLAREEPDISPDAPEEAEDDDTTGGPAARGVVPDEDPALTASLEGDDPRTDSAVSLYDRMGSGGTGAGELVAPDEGAHPDRESDEIATDAGGSVSSAEESAMTEDETGR